MSIVRRMLSILMVAGLLGSVVAGPRSASAAEHLETQCFDVPGITNCLEGQFLTYWRTNGGLPVFGYPITGRADELNADTGKTYLTQWLERNRMELHPENAGTPYEVLLGLLGKDRLKQLGRDPNAEPREAGAKDGCLWFEQTGHNVCDQGSGVGFKTYWQSNGLKISGLDKYGQSLQLFGLPLTEPKMETNSSGDTVITQWFERARFEWHPNNPNEHKVLLGLLGKEVRAGGQPTPPPAAGCANIPAAQNGSITPNCARGTTRMTITGYGFQANEELGFYATDPSQSVIDLGDLLDGPLLVDGSGDFILYLNVNGNNLDDGVYAITFEGKSSGHKTIVYFAGE